jgi:hypothetical protein
MNYFNHIRLLSYADIKKTNGTFALLIKVAREQNTPLSEMVIGTVGLFNIRG